MATTFAGTMYSGVQANPQWVPANRGVYYVLDHTQSQRPLAAGTPTRGNRQDYWRRTGRWGVRRGLGPLGWVFVVPFDKNANFVVSTADDGVEGTIASPPTVQNPPAGVIA
jgi:hypothetical protein